MTDEIIRMEHVSTDRLFDLSFSIQKGQYVTLIGPSGAGKSSLLMLLNRLNDPEEGTIFYKGKPLQHYPILQLRKKVGMVFQSKSLFDGTVHENLSYGPSLHGKEWTKKDSANLLDSVQLTEEFVHKRVEELSGGEQQRVSLVRTLANDPEVLLLDEVTSALDIQTVHTIETLLKEQQKAGKTVLMVTHDVEQAERLGGYSLFLNEGKLVEKGATADMLGDPKTERLKRFLLTKGGDERGT